MVCTMLPIDKEMNDLSLKWGDIACLATTKAEEPTMVPSKPEEPPMADSAKKVFSNDDLKSMEECLMDMPSDGLMDIQLLLFRVNLARNSKNPAISVAVLPPAEADAPRATFVEVVTRNCAKEADCKDNSAPEPETHVCPAFGKKCWFGTECRHMVAPIASSPVMYEGELWDKNDTECIHDLKENGCDRARIGKCNFAHRVHADGSLVHTKK